MRLILRWFFASLIVVVPASVLADTKAPYSKPFHKQGRGWYPSIYWSTGRNLGSFYFPNTNGRKFKPLASHEWDSDVNGLIYVYRPNSQWASEELEAPSYYLNDELVFNLRAGSYTVMEVPAGSYDFATRKSFLPLIGFEAFDDKLMMAFDLNLQADFGLEIDPGAVFYVRHSEVSLPKRLHPDLSPDDEMATADVQLVDAELALEEMAATRYLEHSFWHSNDSERIVDLLNGEMQDYGWFSVIWPWSNNFLFGFPLFELPSDMYRELRGKFDDQTLEEKLYALRDDPQAYLAAIEEYRQPKRNWLAPWRVPRNTLSLNDELLLERLERNARGGNILAPANMGAEALASNQSDNAPWYWPFRTLTVPEESGFELRSSVSEERRQRIASLRAKLD